MPRRSSLLFYGWQRHPTSGDRPPFFYLKRPVYQIALHRMLCIHVATTDGACSISSNSSGGGGSAMQSTSHHVWLLLLWYNKKRTKRTLWSKPNIAPSNSATKIWATTWSTARPEPVVDWIHYPKLRLCQYHRLLERGRCNLTDASCSAAATCFSDDEIRTEIGPQEWDQQKYARRFQRVKPNWPTTISRHRLLPFSHSVNDWHMHFTHARYPSSYSYVSTATLSVHKLFNQIPDQTRQTAATNRRAWYKYIIQIHYTNICIQRKTCILEGRKVYS